jgi:hypothetical protein
MARLILVFLLRRTLHPPPWSPPFLLYSTKIQIAGSRWLLQSDTTTSRNHDVTGLCHASGIVERQAGIAIDNEWTLAGWADRGEIGRTPSNGLS